MVYSGFGDCVRQRTARRDRKSYFLYSDRDRRGNHRIYNGTFVERKKWTDSLGDNAFEVLREKQKS